MSRIGYLYDNIDFYDIFTTTDGSVFEVFTGDQLQPKLKHGECKIRSFTYPTMPDDHPEIHLLKKLMKESIDCRLRQT